MSAGASEVGADAHTYGKAHVDEEPLDELRRLDAAAAERDDLAEKYKAAKKEWNAAKADYDLAKEKLKKQDEQDPDILAKVTKELNERNRMIEDPEPADAWKESAKLLGKKNDEKNPIEEKPPGVYEEDTKEEIKGTDVDDKFKMIMAEMAKIATAVARGKDDLEEMKSGMEPTSTSTSKSNSLTLEKRQSFKQ